MKLVYDHQERIRLIMNHIEAELPDTKQMVPNKNSVIKNCSINSSKKDIELKNAYKERAIKAYKQNKIFTVHGNYRTIRKALLQRGWIEKLSPARLKKLENLSLTRLLKNARKGNDFELAILSKSVQPYEANFIWQPKYFKDTHSVLNPLRNRIRRSRCLDFSTKVGLIGCLENSHWNTIENVAEVESLPSYRLSSREDELYFLQDYRITQCISILVYLIESEQPSSLFEKNGIIPMSVLTFPVQILQDYCKKQDDGFLDKSEEHNDCSAWETFTANSQLLLRNDQKINYPENDFSKILIKSQEVVQKVQKHKPFLFSYGCRNLWILKPGFQCRGQGISIMSNFYNIVNYAASRPKSNYIVQKYIEKPLLIYKTKFDIRQYMVVAIFDEISIWMYKDCYLRFSSREYSLGDLREAIHITNNSIQKKYKNAERDSRLPVHNMWQLSEFKNYLSEKHNSDEAWDDKIYPGFKRKLISIVLSSLEETELTKNTFELYGCDFMLDEKLDPFLIEINSTPDLSASTSVTAKLCPSALEDLMKIVIDNSRNPKAPTGKFELVYQIECPRYCENQTDMAVVGTAKILHNPPVILSKRSKVRKFFKRKVLRKRSHIMKAK